MLWMDLDFHDILLVVSGGPGSRLFQGNFQGSIVLCLDIALRSSYLPNICSVNVTTLFHACRYISIDSNSKCQPKFVWLFQERFLTVLTQQPRWTYAWIIVGYAWSTPGPRTSSTASRFITWPNWQYGSVKMKNWGRPPHRLLCLLSSLVRWAVTRTIPHTSSRRTRRMKRMPFAPPFALFFRVLPRTICDAGVAGRWWVMW